MLQLPPSARDTARSACTASQVGAWVSDSSASRSAVESVRTSRPSAPCPAAGSITSGSITARMRASRPSRFRPAAASTMPSYWPSSSLRSRVSRLPRSGCTSRSGRIALSCTTRRRLEVPTRAPCGSACTDSKRGETQASRGSSRSSTVHSEKPSGISIGTSLSECTARWARPSSSATSSSLTNRPLPPTFDSARSRIWSPLVVMPSSSTLQPKRWRSRDWTCSACHRARRLSRVAMMHGDDSVFMPRLSFIGRRSRDRPHTAPTDRFWSESCFGSPLRVLTCAA